MCIYTYIYIRICSGYTKNILWYIKWYIEQCIRRDIEGTLKGIFKVYYRSFERCIKRISKVYWRYTTGILQVYARYSHVVLNGKIKVYYIKWYDKSIRGTIQVYSRYSCYIKWYAKGLLNCILKVSIQDIEFMLKVHTASEMVHTKWYVS